MPFCVIKSRTIKIICVFILAATLLSISYEGGASALVWLGNSSRLVPIYNVATQKKQVAISFDAAWGADKTEDIMNVLSDFNAGATFFLVGFWVDDYSDMVAKIDEAGFEIGTHSNTHPDMVKLSEENIREELTTSMEKITAITGKSVTLFRPPFGSYNNTLLKVCASLGLKAIQWDVDSLDWKGLSAKSVCERVMKRVKNGSIILMHNNADNVVESTRLTLDWLIKAGYEVTSIGDLVYNDNYTIDVNGTQHAN